MAEHRSDPGRPAGAGGGGARIGFILSSFPGDAVVQLILESLNKLEGVESARLAWNDGAQVQFSAYASFAAPQGGLVERITDELLMLPGFRVEFQGVNRVPFPVFVFNAQPGEPDPDAPRRRRAARAVIEQQLQARRGAARMIREEARRQPRGPDARRPRPRQPLPRAEEPDAAEDEGPAPEPGEEAVRETDERPQQPSPHHRDWSPGRLAPPVAEPGFEGVQPRLRPRRRSPPQPPPEPPRPQPATRAPSPEPEPQRLPGFRYLEDSGWVIGIAEDAAPEADREPARDRPPTGEEAAPGEAKWEVTIASPYAEPQPPDESAGRPIYNADGTPHRREFIFDEAGLESAPGLKPILIRGLNRLASLLFGPVEPPPAPERQQPDAPEGAAAAGDEDADAAETVPQSPPDDAPRNM